MRFGLTESQRKRLFEDLFHAVDEIGSRNGYKECREEWRRLGGEQNLNDQQISDVFKEGMDRGWEQPAMAATMDQKHKTNRLEWIRTMNETAEPVMPRIGDSRASHSPAHADCSPTVGLVLCRAFAPRGNRFLRHIRYDRYRLLRLWKGTRRPRRFRLPL